MKWSTWILFVLSLSLLITAGVMVTRQSKTTPEDFFAGIEKRVAEGRYDREQAIMNLDQVLAEAVDAGDSDLAVRVQLRRGRVLMDVGSFERARADLAAVAALRPGDPSVENDLVELEARSGNYRAARDRVAQIIQRDPQSASARVTLGRLHRAAADRSTQLAIDAVSRTLVTEDEERATGILRRSAALDPSDPRRVALAHELGELLTASDDALLENALVSVDQACTDLAAARDAFAESLQFGTEPEAVAGLIDLYERAGQSGLAVDLATSTIRGPAMKGNVTFARTLLKSLVGLGRLRYASDLASSWTKKVGDMDAEFAQECCEVLWRTRRWEELVGATEVLRTTGDTQQINVANLYRGLAFVELKLWNEGRQFLLLFAKPNDPDPFPKAHAVAWKYLARVYREQSNAIEERQSLEQFVKLDPDSDGEAWLRLAELDLTSRNTGLRMPEMRFAIGMSLLPHRTAELLPRWHEIGAMELRSIGLDIEAARTDLQHGKVWTPGPDAGPYEFYRLAQMHAEEGDYLQAGARVRSLLDLVPGFVPALDLGVEIFGAQEKNRDRMQMLVERVRRGGRTPAIDAVLRSLPLNEQRPADLLALMRADPDRTGRLVLAEDLARRGRPGEALDLIKNLPPEQLGDEGRLLLARAYLDRREPVRALGILAPMGSALYPLPGGIEALVRAAACSGDRPRLEALSQSLAQHLALGPNSDAGPWTLPRARALRIVDNLLAAGDGTAALPLLEGLDGTPKLRGGDVTVRLVACAVLRGDLDAAHAALDRAMAFDTGGAAEYVALLLAAHEGRNAELRGLAGNVSTSGFPGTPLLQAQVALVRGHMEDVRAVMGPAVRARFDTDPWWNLTLLVGAKLDTKTPSMGFAPFLGARAEAAARQLLPEPATVEDAQRLLVRWSAATTPIGAAFARAWLSEMSLQESSQPWAEWLRAHLDTEAGLDNLAIEALTRLRREWPEFGPGWDLEERVLARTWRPAKDVVEFRARRAAALGDLAGTLVRRKLDAARGKLVAEPLTQDRIDEALSEVQAAMAAAPRAFDVLVMLASVQRRAGQPRAALSTLQKILAKGADGPVVARPAPGTPNMPDFVAEYLAALDAASQSTTTPLPRERLQSLVNELLAEWPDDPRAVLAAAELDLSLDALNPKLGVTRAYARLDRFRAAHPDVTLESMGEGALRGWARFESKLDPRRALALLERELALEPQRMTTWHEYGRALEAAGRTQDARETLELAVRISPDGAVLREILRLRSSAELPVEGIEAAAQAILAAEGKPSGDAHLVLLVARCYVNLGPRNLDHALLLLAGLNEWRNLSRDFQVQHSQVSATALLTRGGVEDVALARALLTESEPLVADPYEKVFVRAMKGLARPRAAPAPAPASR